MSNPNHATVRRTLLPGKTVPEWLSTLDAVVDTAAQCTEVQSSPLGLPAFTGLKQAVTEAHTSLSAKQQRVLELIAAAKALNVDVTALRIATRTFEATVAAIAKGDAKIIAKAGLTARVVSPPQVPLGKVSVVHSKPGKLLCESIITWPAGPGATGGYTIEVNFTPQNPTGPYLTLMSGTSRRRIVKGPTPGCQFLVRIASLGSDGSQSEWSDPILATAR
jgi:hypothetical protein